MARARVRRRRLALALAAVACALDAAAAGGGRGTAGAAISTDGAGALLARQAERAASRALTQHEQRVFTVAEGLPQSSALALAQTRDGYMWIGTEAGLARFDGVAFTLFGGPSAPELGGPNVRALLALPDGTLLVGTRGGQCLLRLREGQLEPVLGAPLPTQAALCLFRDGGGGLWLGTWRGAARVVGDSIVEHVLPAGSSSGGVRSIAEAPRGTLWFGTGAGGLVRLRLREGRLEEVPLPLPPGGAGTPVLALLGGADGELWVATDGAGLLRHKDGWRERLGSAQGLPDDRVSALHRDRRGDLWIGTYRGLARLRGGAVDRHTARSGLPDDQIESILEDAEANLWIGTRGGGLVRLSEAPLVTLSRQEGLPSDRAFAVHEAADGALWIGTRGDGLIRVHEGRFQRFTVADGLCTNEVGALASDGAGGLWIAGFGGRQSNLCKHEGGRFRLLGLELPALTARPIRALYRDDAGRMWAAGDVLAREGAGGRLEEVPLGDPERGSAQHGFGMIFSLEQDRRGRLLVGARDGLHIQAGAAFRRPTAPDGSLSVVFDMHEDARGVVWLATARGLFRLDEGDVVTPVALGEEVLWSVLESPAGNLWLGSPRGLHRLRPPAAAGVRPEEPTRFGVGDGMKSDRAEGGHGHGAAVRARAGTLWFATSRGVVRVGPEADAPKRPRVVPRVLVERLAVDGATLLPAGGGRALTVPPGPRDLSVRYTAPSFTAPERIRFRYRLEGFDADWIDAGARRSAFYTRLPPGAYRFLVEARAEDGSFRSAAEPLALVLQPRLYERWQLKLALALCAAALAVLLHRLRVLRIEGRHAAVLAERNRIARELHDTLAQGFTGITLHLRTALGRIDAGSPARARQNIEEADALARSSLADSRSAVWDLRAQALVHGGLVHALTEMARRLSVDAPIDVEVKGRATRLPEEQELVFVRVAQEAVTNALRHARATRIAIELVFDADATSLTVKDDGAGFDAAAPAASGRFGLLGMRERAAALGGAVDIKSEPGAGTTVAVRLPRRR
jgi:signal transduction histidine kinase/ligand-binding sensor domain-containing protein